MAMPDKYCSFAYSRVVPQRCLHCILFRPMAVHSAQAGIWTYLLCAVRNAYSGVCVLCVCVYYMLVIVYKVLNAPRFVSHF